MLKHARTILAAIAATIILACVAATTAPVAPAAADSLTISQLNVNWTHNPANWPAHSVQVAATFVTGPTGPLEVSGMTLSCSPNGTGLWASGNNIHGTDFEWGGIDTATFTHYNDHWTSTGGGTIIGCGVDYPRDTPGDDVDSDHEPRILYTFTTNYGGGQGNVTVTLAVDVWAANGCTAWIVSGPGHLDGGARGCVAIAS